jgi:hypothetical protein
MDRAENDISPTPPSREKESGKVGMAILMWMLGVPGFIVLLYLILR